MGLFNYIKNIFSDSFLKQDFYWVPTDCLLGEMFAICGATPLPSVYASQILNIDKKDIKRLRDDIHFTTKDDDGVERTMAIYYFKDLSILKDVEEKLKEECHYYELEVGEEITTKKAIKHISYFFRLWELGMHTFTEDLIDRLKILRLKAKRAKKNGSKSAKKANDNAMHILENYSLIEYKEHKGSE